MNDEITKISISYNSKEIIIDLNLNDFDIFDSFIKILSEKTGEQNIMQNFELMPVNTSMPYILIDENNFLTIIDEKRETNDLKLFMNKKAKNEEEEEDDDNNNILTKNKNKKIKDSEDDDFSDDEYIQKKDEPLNEINNIIDDLNNKEEKENNFENKINSEINEILMGKNKHDENNNINNSDDFDDDNLNININLIKNNNDNIITEKEEKEKNKINDLNMNNKNKISNKIFLDDLFSDSNDKIDKEKEKEQKNIFNNEHCIKCKNKLKSKKYICIICQNLILCSKCENNHPHPCLIFKSDFISSLKDTYNFISRQYMSHPPNSSKKSKKNLSIFFIGDKDISLRPNKGVLLPLKIVNHSTNSTIFSNDIIILEKGNILIDISYDANNKFKIPPNKYHILKLKCLTPKIMCKETVSLELYSSRYVLKDNKNLKIVLNIDVNEDKAEEELNYKLFYNEMVILYNKEHKKILVNLIENEMKKYNPEEFVDVLIKYNWNKDKFLKNFEIKK